MGRTQGRETVWAAHPSAPLFHRPRWSLQVPTKVLSKAQPSHPRDPPFRAAEDLHHFWCHRSLAREMWLWRASLVAQSLPSWKDALKGGQLRLLWLQHSSMSSVVMLKVGSDGVWLIWGKQESGKSAVHQGEEWNLKLSHHLRKTDWRK